jgi:cobalt-zinc-cadmium efflux system outer membrane protein
MRFRSATCWIVCLLPLTGGCLYPVREQVDEVICDIAAHPLDVHTPATQERPAAQSTNSTTSRSSGPAPKPDQAAKMEADSSPMQQVADFEQQTPQPNAGTPGAAGPKRQFEKRLELPPGLPERKSPEPLPRDATEEQKQAYRARNYPALPALPPLPKPGPGPFGHPLTLSELQQLAMSNSPLLRQATADVEAAEGAAKQAGAYPNPSFGYDSSNVNTGGTAGFQGIFVEQIIKTAGKLKTAQASALMSLLNAQLALRRAQTDLMTQVRSNYFALLVARGNLQLNDALAEFTERLYGVFVDQRMGGQLAPYEPMQLLAFSYQARGLQVAARNHYLGVWRQLVAVLGLEGKMPLTEVAGSADMPVPVFNYDDVLERVLKWHTDIHTARNTLQKARYDLRTAQIMPYPDLDLRVAVHKDFTTPPFGFEHDITAGFAIPLWDQNRGAIRQAQAALLRAVEEEHRARNTLTGNVADAYDRYASNKAQVEYYRDRVLPDLGLVYSRAALRLGGQAQPGPATNAPDISSIASLDIVTHQQLYSTAIATYSALLTAQWQAVADLANLLQIDDLYLGVESPPHLPEPCADPKGLPCTHPCSPLPN